jgi:hypothetical protein
MCIENLANTVDAFLGLHNITKFAMQSWAAIHRALSSALLLGILGEPSRNVRVQNLLMRLSTLMTEVTLNIDPQELSAPLARSVEALSKLAVPPRPPISGVRTMSTDSLASFAALHNIGQTSVQGDSVQSSPEASLLEEDSPFSLLHNIFWGNSNTMPPPQN